MDVVIPVYRPGKEWEQLLEGLARQNRKPDRILVINTGKEYWNSRWEKLLPGMEVVHIAPEAFDHGGTRDRAAQMSRADFLVFMTQDAVPADERLLEELEKAMEQSPDVRRVLSNGKKICRGLASKRISVPMYAPFMTGKLTAFWEDFPPALFSMKI